MEKYVYQAQLCLQFFPRNQSSVCFLFPVYDLVFAFFLICLDALSSPGTVDANNFCKPGPFFGAN
jgi:hypothetical protein